MAAADEEESLGSWELAHGHFGSPSWALPTISVRCDQTARPGYASTKAHEYLDTPEVLAAKIELLAQLLRDSKFPVIYSGAGISTSAGIADYATQTTTEEEEATAQPKSPMAARPSLAHRVLVAMHRAGHIGRWIQQNHDGLAQKAGLPQAAVNEVHGSLYSPANPVIMMTGTLRSDLFDDLIECSHKTDLCIALGTSLSGMNADQVVTRVAKRLRKTGWQRQWGGDQTPIYGAVIIGLQQTQYDSLASLRIYARLDQVFRALAAALPVEPVPDDYLYAPPAIPQERVPEEDVYLVPYGPDGRLLAGPVALDQMLRWDLREDTQIQITEGQFAGDTGEIVGKNLEGHIKIRCLHPIGTGKFKAPMERTLGSWWIQAAIEGSVPCLPVVPVQMQ